jgi:2-polyprenyl-3-methyl-5-hydroxy-6-metoxy-1,4-benzoquinol methylase
MMSLLSLADQVKYYDRRWSNFDYANLYCLERSIFILDALRTSGKNYPRICDLGCGAGWLTNILSSFGPALGVELSPQAVHQARERYPGAEFVCADATKWDPGQEKFDIVVSQEVLEHIVDKPAYLSIARRSLKAGGCLIMTTPNLKVLDAIPELERKAVWETQPIELPVDRRRLTALLAESGFEVIRTSSAVWGAGRRGIHRLVNSIKLQQLLSAAGLNGCWQRTLLNKDFGAYLLTLARAR